MVNTVQEFLKDRDYYILTLYEFYNKRFIDNDFYYHNLKQGSIFFINLNNTEEYNQYIQNNIWSIKTDIENKKRNFLYTSDSTAFKDLNLSYYFPFLKTEEQINVNSNIEDKELVNYIAYKGTIKTGFISFHSKGLTFLSIKPKESIRDFVANYIKLLVLDTESSPIMYSLGDDKSTEPNIEIDEETKALLNTLEEHLEALKQSGKFFIIAPKVEQLLKTYLHNNESKSNEISSLYIDKDFRLFLPQYNNIEIKLAHLTKAIYILFLKRPNGIHLNELQQHKQELFKIYKCISYKLSLDKMEASINDLLHNENTIFVHLSRIKSAFVKQFTNTYAYNYYIQGEKGKEKFIVLPQEKISFETKI